MDAPVGVDTAVVDAPADGPPMGSVQVHATLMGTPATGADIVFADPTGAVVAHVTTDSAGMASANVVAGSSATLVLKAGTAPNVVHILETVMDIQPGDQLELGSPGAGAPPSTDQGIVHVSYSGAVNGATKYLADLGCNSVLGSNTNPVDVVIQSPCLSANGTYDLIATALDADDHVLAYATMSNLSPPGDGITVNATMPAWQTDLADRTFAVTHAPANAALTATAHLFHDTVGYQQTPPATATADASGAATLAPVWVKGAGNALSYNLTITYPGSVTGQPVKSVTGRTATLSSTTDAIDAEALPTLTSRSVSVPTGRATPQATWTASGSLASTKGGLVYLRWTNGAGGTWDWVVAVPAAATSPVQFPDLPDALAENRVTASQAFQTEQILFASTDLFANDIAFRKNFLELLMSPSTVFRSEITGIQ